MSSTVTVEELDQLNLELFKQRVVVDNVKEKLSEEQGVLNDLENKLVAYLKELGRDSYKSPHGSVSIRDIWSVRIPKEEDRAKFFDYLKTQGIFDTMITVNSQTLNSWYKAEFEAAQQRGDGMNFEVPGISPPTLCEKLYVRKANET